MAFNVKNAQGTLLGVILDSDDYAGIVHLKGEKASVSQLPDNAQEGDIWHVTLNDAFYVYCGGWRCLPTRKQADTINALPSNSVEMAAILATLEEGAHVTLLKQ